MQKGMTHIETMTVTKNDTAAFYKSGTLEVFATPAMAALMEKTAMNCVAPYLDEGCATVGTSLEIKHTSASPLGAEITCECVLKEIDGRRLVFDVRASDNAGEIGFGTHERFIINAEKFMKKTAEKI